MKRIITVLLLAFTSAAFSQVVREVGNFDKIKVFDRINVELILGEEESVEITGTRAKDVLVSNNNGELKIAMPPQKLLDGEDVTVKVYYAQLKTIDATEGSYISSNEIFAADGLDIGAKEGANIKLQLKVTSLRSRVYTGGNIKVFGTAENTNVSINTGGEYDGKELQSKKADVEINAGGNASVTASESVKARTKAGGDIHIYGKPASVDQKTVLGGNIIVH